MNITELAIYKKMFGGGTGGGGSDNTWVLNKEITIPHKSFEVEFTSNGNNYVAMEIDGQSDRDTAGLYYSVEMDDQTDLAYSFITNSWEDEAYRTVTFLKEPTDAEFITWRNANAKKQGGGSVEGTAIPVGEKVEKIYFNTALSGDEVNKYLSQLTYVDIGFDTPLNILYAQTSDGITGYFFVVFKRDAESYHICLVTDISTQFIYDIFAFSKWEGIEFGGLDEFRTHWGYGDVTFDSDLPVLTDFNGFPIGAENEKIKNVLSITPFGASGGSSSNKPNAYTVSSVDELPSDAVDGSMAIVQQTAQATKYVFNSKINAPSQRLNIGFYSVSPENDILETPNDSISVGVLGPPVDCLYYGSRNVYYFDNSIGFNVGWIKESYRTIAVVTIFDEEANTWLNENSINTGEIVNVPTSQQLYARINGEWVYKCEVV